MSLWATLEALQQSSSVLKCEAARALPLSCPHAALVCVGANAVFKSLNVGSFV